MRGFLCLRGFSLATSSGDHSHEVIAVRGPSCEGSLLLYLLRVSSWTSRRRPCTKPKCVQLDPGNCSAELGTRCCRPVTGLS